MNIRPLLSRWQTWAWLVTIAFFGAVLSYLVAGLLTPEQPPSAKEQPITMRHVVGLGRGGTQVRWRFAADSTEVSSDGLVTTYRGGKATYYVKSKPAYKLTAPEVTLDVRTQNYDARGGVWLRGLKNAPLQELQTQRVSWNNGTQLLTCPSPVHLKYRGMTFDSNRAEANLLTGEVKIGKTSIRS